MKGTIKGHLINYSNGQIQEQGYYIQSDNGDWLKHGRWTSWHLNGKKESEGKYIFGEKHGKWKEWYDNGETELVERYKNGLLHGTRKLYSEPCRWNDFESTPFLIEKYKNGDKHGKQYKFGYDGQSLTNITLYKYGEYIRSMDF